ncbi:MAG: sulfur carrier protein ThiS [Rhodocyclaceae bacterium]|jgi:sulfur carrier protein|nr:sulfur carrier protein ThiS [Rhodocyclaceae bacterium]
MIAQLDIVLNGQARQLPASSSIADLLVAEGLAGKRVAVERNGEIVPKSQHAATPVAAGDKFEIVVAVGGG